MIFTDFFWDFDGTLFDTYPRICRAFMKGLADFGIAADEGDVMARIKVTLGAAAAHYAAQSGREDVTEEKLVMAYRLHAEEEPAEGIVLYPGAREMLLRVRDAGGANYLYTHRGATAWPAIDRADIRALFRDGITALDGFPPKPDGTALNSMIGKYGLDKQKCAMVGDRRIDLDAAHNAGIAGILFDPEGHCDAPISYRYSTMNDMMADLVP